MFVGERAAGNIAGGKEQFQAAQAALSEGKAPAWIHKRHGWFQGEDGQWRREVLDDDMKLRSGGLKEGKGPMALDQAIKHDELFKVAPNLRCTTIEAGRPTGKGAVAEYDPGRDHIVVRDPKDLKSIAHEVQHAVQNDQGFPEGSRGASGSDPNYRENIGERESRDVEKRLRDQDSKPDLLKTAPKGGRSAG